MLIIAVAFWANILRGVSVVEMPGLDSMLAHLLVSPVDRVLDNGAFDVFAWALVFARVGKMTEGGMASSRQILATLLVGVIAIAPARLAPSFGLVVLGSMLLRNKRTLPAGRQVGLLMLALALEALWASPLLSPLHVLVSRIDAPICGFLFGLLGIDASAHGSTVEHFGANFSIVIWPYCTSSFPLSRVCLAFLVLVIYLNAPLRRRQLPWLCASLISSVVLTELRLLLLGASEESYLWWHDGPGVSVYVLIALVPAVVFPVLATCGYRTAKVQPGNQQVA